MNRENNFKCPETGKEFYINEYKTAYSDGKAHYRDKYNKTLINPENQVELVFIEKDVDWSERRPPATILGNDASSRQKRTEQLSKRSKEHFKKEISEQKYEKNKDLIRKFES